MVRPRSRAAAAELLRHRERVERHREIEPGGKLHESIELRRAYRGISEENVIGHLGHGLHFQQGGAGQPYGSTAQLLAANSR